MATWAEIENGTVRFVYTQDDSYTPPADRDIMQYVEVSDGLVPEKGWKYVDGEFIPVEAEQVVDYIELPGDEAPGFILPEPSLEELQEQALFDVNAEAAMTRHRYTTTIVNQGSVYAKKAEQAVAYKDAGYPDDVTAYQWIMQEAIGVGKTPKEVADVIIEKQDAWNNVIGPAIERERLKGRKKINEAQTTEEVESVKNDALSALQGI